MWSEFPQINFRLPPPFLLQSDDHKSNIYTPAQIQSPAQLHSDRATHFTVQRQTKPETYCVITYAACDMAGEKAAGVSRVSIHAWWWFGSCCVEVVMCPDPDPDPASHTVNLACNDCLVGYLPVVGPGKSLAVAMVADSDSSRGRRGEQHRDKKGDHKVQRKHEKLAWSVFFSEFFLLWQRAEVTQCQACCQSQMHA